MPSLKRLGFGDKITQNFGRVSTNIASTTLEEQQFEDELTYLQ